MPVPASARPRLTVAVTRRLPQPVENRMAELFDVRLREVDVKMTRDELSQAMRDCDVLVPTVTDHIDAGLLAQSGERMRMNLKTGKYEVDPDHAAYTGVIVGARADEEGSRSKERYFSPRDKNDDWDVGDVPPARVLH